MPTAPTDEWCEKEDDRETVSDIGEGCGGSGRGDGGVGRSDSGCDACEREEREYIKKMVLVDKKGLVR
jgi:hypothetical protein